MRIIKQGLTAEELKQKKAKKFRCLNCECIFEANEDEYTFTEDYIYGTFTCKCPNCGDTAAVYNGGQLTFEEGK